MNRDITATVFGGDSDFETSAYDNHRIGDVEIGCALPSYFHGSKPQVMVINRRNARSVICDIVDVGPWNTNDIYWENGDRPQAESGVDKRGRHTNKAGIDLTPAAAKAIGIDGMGQVDWVFVAEVLAEMGG